MKKSLILSLACLMGISAMAQEKAAYIYRFGNRYMHDGVEMNSREYAGFLKNNAPEVFKQYQEAHKLVTAGWALFGAGLVMDIAGGAMMGIQAMRLTNQVYNDIRVDMTDVYILINPEWQPRFEGDQYFCDMRTLVKNASNRIRTDAAFQAGYIIEGIGGAALVSSVPLLIIGYVRQHNTANTYNRVVVENKAAYITLNATRGGAGIALNF